MKVIERKASEYYLARVNLSWNLFFHMYTCSECQYLMYLCFLVWVPVQKVWEMLIVVSTWAFELGRPEFASQAVPSVCQLCEHGQVTLPSVNFLISDLGIIVQLFVSPWTRTHQAPLSMEFSRQEYWSGLPFPSGDLPDPGIKPRSPALQADSSPSELQGSPQ